MKIDKNVEPSNGHQKKSWTFQFSNRPDTCSYLTEKMMSHTKSTNARVT